jgi:hypothetical protein
MPDQMAIAALSGDGNKTGSTISTQTPIYQKIINPITP